MRIISFQPFILLLAHKSAANHPFPHKSIVEVLGFLCQFGKLRIFLIHLTQNFFAFCRSVRLILCRVFILPGQHRLVSDLLQAVHFRFQFQICFSANLLLRFSKLSNFANRLFAACRIFRIFFKECLILLANLSKLPRNLSLNAHTVYIVLVQSVQVQLRKLFFAQSAYRFQPSLTDRIALAVYQCLFCNRVNRASRYAVDLHQVIGVRHSRVYLLLHLRKPFDFCLSAYNVAVKLPRRVLGVALLFHLRLHHRLFRRLAVLHRLGERNICVGSIAISYILAYTGISK